MITTSHKPQAKRITTRTLYSSTDVTNLKKRITMGPGELTESLFFLLIKSLKQQASSLLSLYFFLFEKASSNKQERKKPQATSSKRAHLLLLDNLYYKII